MYNMPLLHRMIDRRRMQTRRVKTAHAIVIVIGYHDRYVPCDEMMNELIVGMHVRIGLA